MIAPYGETYSELCVFCFSAWVGVDWVPPLRPLAYCSPNLTDSPDWPPVLWKLKLSAFIIFKTPTHCCFPVITFFYTDASCWRNLSLTGLSKVNMQHMFVCATLKSHTDWNNEQRVRAQQYHQLLSVVTHHGLNAFSHVIYVPQTIKILQNLWLTQVIFDSGIDSDEQTIILEK